MQRCTYHQFGTLVIFFAILCTVCVCFFETLSKSWSTFIEKWYGINHSRPNFVFEHHNSYLISVEFIVLGSIVMRSSCRAQHTDWNVQIKIVGFSQFYLVSHMKCVFSTVNRMNFGPKDSRKLLPVNCEATDLVLLTPNKLPLDKIGR